MESGEEAEAPAPRRTRRSAAASQDGAGEGMSFQIHNQSLLLGRSSRTHIQAAKVASGAECNSGSHNFWPV